MAVRVQEAARPFTKKFQSLSGRVSLWEAWADFVYMTAAAISNAVDKTHAQERETAYMRIIGKYDKREQEMFPDLVAELVDALERNPEQDFLGSVFMELNLGSHWHGQFFTPYSICECMAELSCHDAAEKIREQGFITINDPACGAGATLIAACHTIGRALEKDGLNWQNHVMVTGQDVDQVAGLMCYIQMSFQGAAGYVKIGNTLTDPMREGDDTGNYWFTPMYFSPAWSIRRALNHGGIFLEPGK